MSRRSPAGRRRASVTLWRGTRRSSGPGALEPVTRLSMELPDRWVPWPNSNWCGFSPSTPRQPGDCQDVPRLATRGTSRPDDNATWRGYQRLTLASHCRPSCAPPYPAIRSAFRVSRGCPAHWTGVRHCELRGDRSAVEGTDGGPEGSAGDAL